MTTVAPYPLQQWIEEIVPHVFDTMLSLHATPGAPRRRGQAGARITGAIGIVGPNVSGVLYLHLSLPFATVIAARLLNVEEPSDADINDVVAEFCNMIGGQFKSTLSNHDLPCAMSTPSIIRGSAFAIESNPKAWNQTCTFECLAQTISVELHLEHQDL